MRLTYAKKASSPFQRRFPKRNAVGESERRLETLECVEVVTRKREKERKTTRSQQLGSAHFRQEKPSQAEQANERASEREASIPGRRRTRRRLWLSCFPVSLSLSCLPLESDANSTQPTYERTKRKCSCFTYYVRHYETRTDDVLRASASDLARTASKNCAADAPSADFRAPPCAEPPRVVLGADFLLRVELEGDF